MLSNSMVNGPRSALQAVKSYGCLQMNVHLTLVQTQTGDGMSYSPATAASESSGTRAAGECLLARRTLPTRRCFLVELLHGFRGSR